MIQQLQRVADEAGLQALGTAPAIDEVRQEFPWANCVLVAAICYLPPDRTSTDTIPRGLVAKFAQSADYHTVLRSKLEVLTSAIRAAHPQARLEICIDTCPLPERKLAVLAGIAQRGKSGNVFVPGCGSYAALGEIVTDIPFPPTASAPDTTFDACADCNLCAQSCPTRAITAPGVIDRARCVSSLTQMPGIVPRDLRPNIGAQIYGCDTCQQLCPRNAEIRPISPEFTADTFPGPCPELIPLLTLSPQAFTTQVKPSSIGWIRRTRIRRNAAIAAGNLRCAQATDPLIEMLSDTNPTLRAHAAWSLGQIASPQALDALNQSLITEQDPTVIEEITTALANKLGDN